MIIPVAFQIRFFQLYCGFQYDQYKWIILHLCQSNELICDTCSKYMTYIVKKMERKNELIGKMKMDQWIIPFIWHDNLWFTMKAVAIPYVFFNFDATFGTKACMPFLGYIYAFDSQSTNDGALLNILPLASWYEMA